MQIQMLYFNDKYNDSFNFSLTQDNVNGKESNQQVKNMTYELGKACKSCVFDRILRPHVL